MKLFNFKKLKSFNNEKKNNIKIDPYINIGNIVKDSRLKRNLSAKDLSSLSKIPLSTIIGIENNIKELIPPYPFTRSILLKLEEYLHLDKFILIKLANKEKIPIQKKIKRNFILNKFDIFDSWLGSLIYFFIIVISIYALNSYYLNNRIIEFKFLENTSK